MARENLKRSDEEEDTLIRSTKKFKENHIPGVEHDSNPVQITRLRVAATGTN